MSKRRQAGEIVIKRENAGFLGSRARIRIEPEETPDPCMLYSKDPKFDLCGDPDCREWANCAVLNDDNMVIFFVYHVSECQMEDVPPPNDALQRFLVGV